MAASSGLAGAGRPYFCRGILLHTQGVTVTASDERAAASCSFVCAALPGGPENLAGPVLEVSFFQDDAITAEDLMRRLVTRLVWDYADGLALHTAAIEFNGRVILFPAKSGSGKSTLAVYLAARGHGFATDELVFVPNAGREVHPLPRPAHLKPPSLFVLQDLPSLAASHHVLRYAHGALVSPLALHAMKTPPLELHALVVPDYAPDSSPALERLDPGAATYSLLAALLNARNLPTLGVAEASRLARVTPAYRMSYRTLEEAMELLQRVAR